MLSASETQLQHISVLLQFPLAGVVIPTDAATLWGLLFSGFRISLSASGPWSSFMCKVHISLRELHVVVVAVCNGLLVTWKGG